MFCKKCGFQLEPNDKFCKNCGQLIEVQMNNGVNNANGQINSNLNTFTGYSNNQTSNSNNYNNMENFNPVNVSNNNIGSTNSYGQMNVPNSYDSMLNNIPSQSIYTPNNNMMSSNRFVNTSNGNPNGKGNVAIIIVIFVLAVIAAFCVIALPKIINKDNNSENSTNANTYNVKYDGFSFNIPNYLDYEISEEDGLSIYSDDKGWLIYILIQDGSYDRLKNNVEQAKNSLIADGYIVSKYEYKTYENREFLNFHVSLSGQNFIYSFVKYDSSKLFVLGVFDINNQFDEELFNTISSILATAEYSPSSNSMKANIPSLNQVNY